MLTSKQRRKSHLAYDPKTYNISQSQQICVGIKNKGVVGQFNVHIAVTPLRATNILILTRMQIAGIIVGCIMFGFVAGIFFGCIPCKKESKLYTEKMHLINQ